MIKHILHSYFPAHTLYILKDLNEETDLVIESAWFVLGTKNCFSLATKHSRSGGSFPRGHGGPQGKLSLNPAVWIGQHSFPYLNFFIQ